MSSDLGFGKTKKLDLSDFERKLPISDEPKIDLVADRVAARAGFESREPTERFIRTRKRTKEPTDNVFVRAPLSVINRFKEHCDNTGKSYGEALAELMNKAGI